MSFRLKLALVLLAVLAAAYVVFIIMAPDSLAPTPDDMSTGVNGRNGTDVITDQAQVVLTNSVYANGEHMVRGTIQLPTPCYDLVHEVMILESYPEQVVISFTSADRGGICVQVIDDRAFEVKFRASEQANVRATLNGKPLILQTQSQ